jgi:hypothetical protein
MVEPLSRQGDSVRTLDYAQALALQTHLNDVFKRYGLEVAVGLTKGGVAIRSQDERVDAINLGTVRAL